MSVTISGDTGLAGAATGALNGSLGATTPSTVVATDLTTTGNTILGNASTDTLNVGNGDLIKDASGNVGIGTASPNSKLEVVGQPVFGISTEKMNLGGGSIGINRNVATGVIYDTGGYAYQFQHTSSVSAASDFLALQVYAPAGTQVTANGLVVNGSGNVGIGLAPSASARLSVLTTGATYAISGENNTSSGVAAGSFLNNNGASSGVVALTTSLGTGSANTNCYHLASVTQGTAFWYLYGNGTTSFTSDLRLKKNIESARDGYAEDLCKLRVVKYQWNSNDDSSPKELGLIAQEVEAVFPNLVQDATQEIQGFTPKVLKGSVLPFMLLKAIQEQQALITSLTARLEVLEAK